jgi:hypothetical protein
VADDLGCSFGGGSKRVASNIGYGLWEFWEYGGIRMMIGLEREKLLKVSMLEAQASHVCVCNGTLFLDHMPYFAVIGLEHYFPVCLLIFLVERL